MRTRILLLLALLAAPAEAAEPAPPPSWMTRGGYVGATLGATSVRGDGAVLFGIRAGSMPTARLAIGAAYYAVENRLSLPEVLMGGAHPSALDLEYGGLAVEYFLAPRRRVHAAVGVLVGAGSVSYRQSLADIERDGRATDRFVVVDPTLTVELAIFEFMRAGAFVDYRVATRSELADRALSAVGAGLLVRVGKF
jgi:hypothetical protein